MEVIKKNKKYILFFLALMMTDILYLWINRLELQPHLINLSLDAKIPLIKEMIVVYILYYLYIGGTFIYLFIKEKELLDIHFTVVIISRIIALFIFVIYPTYMMRPTISGNDIFSRLIIMTYKNDNPVNLFPSLHVINAVLSHMAILNIKRVNKSYKVASWVFMVLVIVSTMTVKQHYFLDVVAGYLLAMGVSVVIYSKTYPDYKLSTIKEVFGDRKKEKLQG